MILLLTCSCNGVIPLMRGTLRSAGIQDWLDYPIYQGKKYALQTLDQFPDYYKNLPEWGALYNSIERRSSFAVVVGYDANNFRWADIAMGDIKSKIDGEVIIKGFANIE